MLFDANVAEAKEKKIQKDEIRRADAGSS